MRRTKFQVHRGIEEQRHGWAGYNDSDGALSCFLGAGWVEQGKWKRRIPKNLFKD